MKNSLLLLASLLLFACSEKTTLPTNVPNTGLLIVDAQKWFIPGHPESMYTLWHISGHDRGAEELIGSMDSVLTWANHQGLPIFVTYEGSDTGKFDLPSALKSKLDSNRTTHYVKYYYAATKHKDFSDKIEKTGIKNWIVIGAETDVCVYQTVKELLKKKLNVALVKEAIYSGRNKTQLSFDNLVLFGADTIRIADLKKSSSLFTSSPKTVEAPLLHDSCIVTIVSDKNTPKDSAYAGNTKRLEYLKKYAQIIGLPIEEINEKSEIKPTTKTRLLAGFVTTESYERIASKTPTPLLLISDCTTNSVYIDQPKSWQKTTLKMFFYELMETASFYGKTEIELSGWQRELKKAMNEGRLDYVESSQNF